VKHRLFAAALVLALPARGAAQTTVAPAGATPFSPALGTAGRFGPPPNPTINMWIGGTVNPAPTAKPGIYQGTVVLSLTYL
jgi:hypothetical protein